MSLPPPTLSYPSRLSQSTDLSSLNYNSKFPLAVCFTYGNVYFSCYSPFIPHSSSPTVSTSLFSMSVSLLHAKLLQSCLTLCNAWTVAHQAPLSMGFSRPEYWSGLPCPPPADLPAPGIEPVSLTSAALEGMFFTTTTTWEAPVSLLLPCK